MDSTEIITIVLRFRKGNYHKILLSQKPGLKHIYIKDRSDKKLFQYIEKNTTVDIGRDCYVDMICKKNSHPLLIKISAATIHILTCSEVILN